MSAFAYYNEIDENAAAWLRELITQGVIADGVVDTRPVQDVDTADLAGFTQCHFFAGIGVWSYALRLAGWPDDHPVWTGSCPCQPFSVSGKKQGFTDDRHLWPYWIGHISEHRPPVVFGEQVASPDGLHWLDAVHADLEGQGYAVGVADLCAAGVGAPHIRQRLYFVADTLGAGLEGHGGHGDDRDEPRRIDALAAGSASARGVVGGLADHDENGRHRIAASRLHGRRDGAGGDQPAPGDVDRACGHDAAGCGEPRELADTESRGRREHGVLRGATRGGKGARQLERADEVRGAGPTDGHWRVADWLLCRDGKFRPVEPGTFPLAHGAPARVGRLRGFGNAIVAQVAETFIRAYLDARGGLR